MSSSLTFPLAAKGIVTGSWWLALAVEVGRISKSKNRSFWTRIQYATKAKPLTISSQIILNLNSSPRKFNLQIHLSSKTTVLEFRGVISDRLNARNQYRLKRHFYWRYLSMITRATWASGSRQGRARGRKFLARRISKISTTNFKKCTVHSWATKRVHQN